MLFTEALLRARYIANTACARAWGAVLPPSTEEKTVLESLSLCEGHTSTESGGPGFQSLCPSAHPRPRASGFWGQTEESHPPLDLLGAHVVLTHAQTQ